MLIGLNVAIDPLQTIGFNPAAARAMRPPAVRYIVTHPEDIIDWIGSARYARLKVWWCLPIETMTAVAAEHALARILNHARDITAGIELGDRPALRRDAHPIWFCDRAYQLARFLPSVAECDSRGAGRLPVVLGTGFDGSAAAWRWTDEVLERIESLLPHLHYAAAFTGLGVAGTSTGRPLRWRLFRELSARVQASRWRLAFTTFGWPIGSPLTRWQTIVANWREVTGERPLAPGWTTLVDRQIRNRWISEGVADAQDAIHASHVFLDPELPTHGGQRWPLYDAPFGRPDPFWLSLMHRTAGGKPVMPATRVIRESELPRC